MSTKLSPYLVIFTFLCFTILLIALLQTMSLFSSVYKPDVEKLTAYECGFNPFNDAWKKFNVRYYRIAVLFLIFDLETVLLFPLVLVVDSIFSFGYWIIVDFFFELLLGYIYIWCLGALEWD